jgi:hypothetical protein
MAYITINELEPQSTVSTDDNIITGKDDLKRN